MFRFLNTVYAADPCGPALGIPCNPIASDNLAGAIILIVLYLLSIAGIVTLAFLVFGGIKYIFSVGNEERMKSAKDAFSSAALGLIIILLAYTILSIVYRILNG